MECLAEDLKEVAVKNSFVYFLIAISKLHLSREVSHLLKLPYVVELEYFFVRNRKYVRELGEAEGILIL